MIQFRIASKKGIKYLEIMKAVQNLYPEDYRTLLKFFLSFK